MTDWALSIYGRLLLWTIVLAVVLATPAFIAYMLVRGGGKWLA